MDNGTSRWSPRFHFPLVKCLWGELFRNFKYFISWSHRFVPQGSICVTHFVLQHLFNGEMACRGESLESSRKTDASKGWIFMLLFSHVQRDDPRELVWVGPQTWSLCLRHSHLSSRCSTCSPSSSIMHPLSISILTYSSLHFLTHPSLAAPLFWSRGAWAERSRAEARIADPSVWRRRAWHFRCLCSISEMQMELLEVCRKKNGCFRLRVMIVFTTRQVFALDSQLGETRSGFCFGSI